MKERPIGTPLLGAPTHGAQLRLLSRSDARCGLDSKRAGADEMVRVVGVEPTLP
ncbi:MAG TPA: hypothetical protein VG848_04260 [Acetobacteraceae bacterium]|nr:hypothetical protein [Acetobacteraceae bacterium]